ncbi:MAG TPA: hypothetical protein VGP99_04250 [Tepidisphaeraceae bacterium]|jgi:hypothetical protein|nr:hypothetical protein [Tepidisphaeraceae bacterium]
MFDEPGESPQERVLDPAQRAREKADEFRVHAEVAAVFEGPRKFDAEIRPRLKDDVARDIQKRIAKLEKSKSAESPILPPESAEGAADLLGLPAKSALSTNDYHIHRRPGEMMIVRWLEGKQVETFYERMQAHFDVAMEDYRDEQRQAHGWKQDEKTVAYIAALDAIEVKMADQYLRGIIAKHKVFVLSTLTADQMDILHLCDYVMGVEAAEVVGTASAPGDEPTEQNRSWFFKLFSLRGIIEGVERMCFFAYLQKTEETMEGDW